MFAQDLKDNWTVYILLSEKDKKLYVGCTNNLRKRIDEHNSGKVSSTQYRRPLILIHTEEFKDKSEAFAKEKFLKSLWGAREKSKILKEYIKKSK